MEVGAFEILRLTVFQRSLAVTSPSPRLPLEAVVAGERQSAVRPCPLHECREYRGGHEQQVRGGVQELARTSLPSAVDLPIGTFRCSRDP